MKAVVLHNSCEASDLHVSDVKIPEVKPGWVLIKVKAFGINHSEVLLRQFEVDRPYIKNPIIPGIECVGEVVDKSDTNLKNGQRVIAMMGGMGRSFDGSYAEYALIPQSHLFTIDSKLEWNEIAAIPETYYTAFGSLTLSLQLKKEDTLLIRGGTSTVGLAAIQLAKAIGAKVIATTRSEKKAVILKNTGADGIVIESDDFKKRFLHEYPSGANKVLELIGASTIIESLHLTQIHGIVCHTGLLGNVFSLKEFDPIKEIPSGVYLTGFYSNSPTQRQIDEMMNMIESNAIHPIVAATFTLENIAKAHELAETRGQTGKIVVTV